MDNNKQKLLAAQLRPRRMSIRLMEKLKISGSNIRLSEDEKDKLRAAINAEKRGMTQDFILG